MADTKIKDLTLKTPAATTDELVINDVAAGNTDKKISIAEILGVTGTLTNKTVNLSSNTLTGTTAQFNTALSDGDFATQAGTETLTNKTLALGSNTVSGTLAQFNTALTDDDFAALATAQTFTTNGKTFNDNILKIRNPADTFSYSLRSSAITAARDLTLPLVTANDTLMALALAQSPTNKTFDYTSNVEFRVGTSEDPSAATSLTISGLDGDNHKVYHIKARIPNDTTPGYLRFRLNGDTGNNYTGGIDSGGVLQTYTSIGYMQLQYEAVGNKMAASETWLVDIMVFPRTGTARKVQSSVQLKDTFGYLHHEGHGTWSNTADNLTSITFVKDSGNIGGSGTDIKVYAMP